MAEPLLIKGGSYKLYCTHPPGGAVGRLHLLSIGICEGGVWINVDKSQCFSNSTSPVLLMLRSLRSLEPPSNFTHLLMWQKTKDPVFIFTVWNKGRFVRRVKVRLGSGSSGCSSAVPRRSAQDLISADHSKNPVLSDEDSSLMIRNRISRFRPVI